MTEQLEKEENVRFDGTFEDALETLKNNKSLKANVEGFKVREVKLTGNNFIRTVEIKLVKDDLGKSVENVLQKLCESTQQLASKILEDLKKANKED